MMTYVLQGKNISKQGKLRFGCSATLFNPDRTEILLTRRSDNGMWCLPGGMFEAGESVSDGCVREVLEETGMQVRVIRLTGVYSNQDNVVVYPDGNKAHTIVLNFEVELISGSPGLSTETIEIKWISIQDVLKMELFHGHVEHVRDALEMQQITFLR